VLIVRTPGDETIVLRLRAELSSYRFRVVELTAAARRSEPLAQLATEREAQAALRAKPDTMAVELWVRAGARGNDELVSAGPGRDAEVLALRVTEAMRARGLTLPPLAAAAAPAADSGKPSAAPPPEPDVDVAVPTVLPPMATPIETTKPTTKTTEPEPTKPTTKATEPEPAKPPPAKVPAPAREPDAKQPEREPEPEAEEEEEARAPEDDIEPGPLTAQPATGTAPREALLYVEAGPTGVWSPGANSISPALDALISVRFRPYPTSSISLVGLIPLLSSSLETADGASIDVRSFGIGGFGDLHLPLGRVELSAGIGGLALLTSVLAQSADDGPVYVSDYPSRRLGALLGRVGASVSLTRDLRLAGSIMIGLTVRELQISPPRTAATMDDEPSPIASWGKPLLLGTLSLELALPWDR
jgi:outer membrane biosynthesis protein TonB